MKIQLKRAYDPPSKDDGKRILVERLWPRGIKKENLKCDQWLKEIAPSTELRKWYEHDPQKWDEFQQRYKEELHANKELVDALLKEARHGSITLLYSSKSEEFSCALCLKNYLMKVSC